LELVIGDEALARRCEFEDVLDLSKCWWEVTQLPFVFAIWQTSLDHMPSAVADLLVIAAKTGQEKMRRTPNEYLPATLPKQTNGHDIDLQSYWQAIQYELTPKHLEAVKLYFSMYRMFVLKE
jgi:chorismate dehydratase